MAATNEIKVSSERLNSAASVITNEAAKFYECMNQIETQVKSLSQSWEGSSADAFMEQFMKLRANFDAYKTTVDEQSAALTKAAQFYEERESKITSDASMNLSNSQILS